MTFLIIISMPKTSCNILWKMLHEINGLNMAKIVNCTKCLKNKLYKFYKKTLAFTLAETLIVMGVIGVVAALTLPNLNSSTNNNIPLFLTLLSLIINKYSFI